MQHLNAPLRNHIMFRLILMSSIFLLTDLGALAQFSRFYTVKKSSDFDTVDFCLKATVSNCVLKQSIKDSHTLTIYGNPDLEKINPSFVRKIKNNTCYIAFDLDEYNSSDFSDSFTLAVSRSDKNNDFWEINLNKINAYRLNLNYGFGNADINLTGSSVQRLKINSGSADIVVGYDEGRINPIQMDTFFIKADFGSILAKRMELTRAKNVITKIGFGNVFLNFGHYFNERCSVNASVGAGNLEVILPPKGTPVIIHLNDSPLCSVRIAEDFEEVGKNVFVNMDYSNDAENLLSFDVEVTLGIVSFEYAD